LNKHELTKYNERWQMRNISRIVAIGMFIVFLVKFFL